MFYDLILLRQSRGKLGTAWLAATRGIHHVNKKEINEINIEDLCVEITNYVCSSSSSARQRFSLRLSAILINGVVKIYREQATQFLRLVVENFTVTRIPTVLQLSPDEIPAIPAIHRVKTKSKKPRRKANVAQPTDTPLEDLLAKIQSQEVFTPQELDNIEKNMDTAQPITTAASVTLIEIPKLTVEDDDQLGVIDEKELQMLLGDMVLEPPPERVPVPEPQTLTQTETQIPAITLQEPDKPIQPSNVITVVADVHAPVGEYLDIGTVPSIERILPPVPSQQQEIETIQEVAPEQHQQDRLVEIETIQVVPEQQQQIETARRRPSKRRRDSSESRRVRETSKDKFVDSKLFIQMKPKITRTIDRTEKYEMKSFKRYQVYEPQIEIKSATTKLLLDRYHVILEPEPDQVVVREDSASKKSSVVAPVKKATRQTIQSEVLLQQEQQKIQEIPMEITQIRQPSIEPVRATIITPQSQIQVPIVDQQIESTPLASKVQATPEIAAETPVQQPVAERVPLQEPMEIDSLVHPTQLVAVDLSEIRQQNIMTKVLEAGRPLAIEDVCPVPVNRWNIAKTFNDLLVLSKAGYVALEGDEFCELKFIHKGRKFTA